MPPALGPTDRHGARGGYSESDMWSTLTLEWGESAKRYRQSNKLHRRPHPSQCRTIDIYVTSQRASGGEGEGINAALLSQQDDIEMVCVCQCQPPSDRWDHRGAAQILRYVCGQTRVDRSTERYRQSNRVLVWTASKATLGRSIYTYKSRYWERRIG